MCLDGAADHRDGKKLFENARSIAQILDGFEERHHAQLAGFLAIGIAEEASIFRDEIKAKDIAHMLRHGEHEGANGFRIRPFHFRLDDGHEIKDFARLVRKTLELRHPGHGALQLRHDPVGPGLASRLGCGLPAVGGKLGIELAENPIEHRGVLAKIETD